MSVHDENGNLVENPDLNLGYIDYRTRIIHHDAIPERPQMTERILKSVDPKNPKSQLYEEVVTQTYEPGRPARDEEVTDQIYIPYTPEELAERERQREEAEAAAAAAAAKQARMDALPGEVDDLNEAVAEVGVMTADNAVSNEDLMEAVAELGAMVAELTETIKEVSNG